MQEADPSAAAPTFEKNEPDAPSGAPGFTPSKTAVAFWHRSLEGACPVTIHAHANKLMLTRMSVCFMVSSRPGCRVAPYRASLIERGGLCCIREVRRWSHEVHHHLLRSVKLPPD